MYAVQLTKTNYYRKNGRDVRSVDLIEAQSLNERQAQLALERVLKFYPQAKIVDYATLELKKSKHIQSKLKEFVERYRRENLACNDVIVEFFQYNPEYFCYGGAGYNEHIIPTLSRALDDGEKEHCVRLCHYYISSEASEKLRWHLISKGLLPGPAA